MKRKMVMGLPPKEPGSRDGKTVTVQRAGDILVLDYFRDGTWKKRYCLNLDTDEHETFHVGAGVWKQEGVTSLYSSANAYWRSGYQMWDEVGMQQEDWGLAMEALGTKRENIFAVIEGRERDRNTQLRYRKIDRKKERINRLMASLPPLPMAIRMGWAWEAVGKKKHYAFYDKGTGTWSRTCCQDASGQLERTDGGAKVRHNDEVRCTACGSLLTAKKRVGHMEAVSRAMVLQRIDDGKSVARHMKVMVRWSGEGIKTYESEEVRIILHRVPERKCDIYYAQDNDCWDRSRWSGMEWWTTNVRNKRTGKCLLYPDGVQDALKGTGYAEWACLFAQMAGDQVMLDYNRLMAAGIAKSMVEYLYKGRFWRLLDETVGHISINGNYYGDLNIFGENEREVFQIRDRQKILRVRQEDGGENYVEWMRFSEQAGCRIGGDTMAWLDRNGIGPDDTAFIRAQMTPQQVMNYVEKQRALSYQSLTAKEVLGQWEDYLSMCKAAGKDLDDEMVYRPRELKRRHDEMVVHRQKALILRDMERDPERNARYADEMAAKYPGAEENLKAVRGKYEYQNGEYMVIVPERLVDIVKEGNALHHCAGASERYFERIMSRETYICFLRRADEPQIPFYTIEVEPDGTIRQHRSYLDEEPGIEEIRGFLKEWQKEVKGRVREEDLELQKASAEKREKNLQELREKNNTRVLKALMEDFMEAV